MLPFCLYMYILFTNIELSSGSPRLSSLLWRRYGRDMWVWRGNWEKYYYAREDGIDAETYGNAMQKRTKILSVDCVNIIYCFLFEINEFTWIYIIMLPMSMKYLSRMQENEHLRIELVATIFQNNISTRSNVSLYFLVTFRSHFEHAHSIISTFLRF